MACGTSGVYRVPLRMTRKNVTAKFHSGDISRKRKLLEKRKEGKKRMKSMNIPLEAFIKVLKTN